MTGQGQSCVVWVTDLPGAGKITLSGALAHRLRRDGEEMRRVRFTERGFSKRDCDVHLRGAGHSGRLLARCGMVTIVATHLQKRGIVAERGLW